MALTELKVKSTKPREKAYKLSDEKGLYLLVQPAGGKLWRFDYRFFGKRKTLALGVYPDVSLQNARDKRDVARKQLSSDPPVDPSVYKLGEKLKHAIHVENSFEAVAREWWESHMQHKADSHKNKVMRRFETYIFPWLGKKSIGEITSPELFAVIQKVVNANLAETAKRCLQTVGQVYRYAVRTGKVSHDITTALTGIISGKRVVNMAAFTDPKDLAAFLRASDAFKGTFTVLCALKLLPLIFCRPGELRKARWREIDFDGAVWRYGVSKTKICHLVPLSKQAISILKDLKNLSGSGEFVFMGGRNPRRPMSEAAINAGIKRMGYCTKTEITGHGFRATARTILHERLRIDPHVIEHQLAHKVPDVLGTAYNRTKFIDVRKVMMQTWADYLDEIKVTL